MKNFNKYFSFLAIAILIGSLYTSCRKDIGPVVVPPAITTPVSFRNDVQPIFNASCISCHNATHQYLQLDSCCSYYELFFTGANAPYVDTLNPSQSLIIKRMTGEIGPTMPLTGQLPQDQIDLVLRWIEEGAKNN